MQTTEMQRVHVLLNTKLFFIIVFTFKILCSDHFVLLSKEYIQLSEYTQIRDLRKITEKKHPISLDIGLTAYHT